MGTVKRARAIIWLLGLFVGVIVLVVSPGYFYISYSYTAGNLASETEINARIISQNISRNPEFWEFEHTRIQEYLSQRPMGGVAETRRIFNIKNDLITQSVNELPPPITIKSCALMDSGVVVGRLEIARSLRPLLEQTGKLALVSTLLGLCVYLILRALLLQSLSRAQTLVEQNEERYRAVVENIPMLLCRFLSDGTISFVNEAFCQYFDKTPEQLLGQIFRLPVLDGMQRLEPSQLAFLTADNPTVTYELGVTAGNGEPRWQRWTVHAIFQDGAYVEFQSIGEDVTERRQAEEAITQQLNFQQTLIDTIPSPIFYKDTEGRYLGCNTSFESYVGRRKTDIIGKTVHEIAPGDLAELYLQADLTLFRDPGFQQYETSVLYADGTRHDVFFTKGTFTDLEGRVAGLVGVMLDITERKRTERELSGYRDRLEDLVRERTAELEKSNQRLTLEITERKQAEDALRESRQMLHLVLDTIPVRVFWKDVDANYLGCNRPFVLDAGFQSPEEIIGRNDFEMVWAEQAQLYISDDLMVIETGRPKLGYEEPRTTPSGDRVWLRTSKVPLCDVKGGLKGVLGIYEDITAHKWAEEALQKAHDELERRVEERTSELEKANHELRQIPSKLIAVQEEERKRLASELHDSIGQTLAAVKFWVEMSLKLRDEGNGNAAFNHLGHFVPILQRSIEETRSVYMGLRPSMLDSMGLLPALEWLRRECMKLYPERHIEFETGVAEEEIPESLKINIFRITQEALNNVAKHSEAEWVDITLSKNCDKIELVVSDDGIGMDLELILSITTANSLGLTSMRERAELTGGSFSIESAPGEGTTVRGSWPCVESSFVQGT